MAPDIEAAHRLLVEQKASVGVWRGPCALSSGAHRSSAPGMPLAMVTWPESVTALLCLVLCNK